MTENTVTNYLGRCKGCDYALFATPESIQQADNAVAGGPAVNVGNGQIMGRCTNGHRWFMLRRVAGTYSESHKCDSRCLNAKGHDCTCSCGGANHGRGHAVAAVQVKPSGTAYNQWRDKLAAREQLAAERYEPVAPQPVKLPQPGDMLIAYPVRCTYVQHNVGQYNATLYLFATPKGTTLKWFAPDYLSNFCEAGNDLRIDAEVKRLDEYQGKTSVIITRVSQTAQEA